MKVQDLEKREKKRLKDISPEVEERLMERHLEELDRHTVDRIERRYGRYIPQARLERARKQRVDFLHHPEYREHLRDIGLKPKEHEKILGDYSEGKIWVDQDRREKLRTVAHERLHQLSDPLYRSMFGEKIDEGTTEYLSREVAGDPHLADAVKSYPSEVRLAEMLSARVGDEPIGKAYFQGDWVTLRAMVNRELGDGATAEIVRLAQQGKYQEAEEIIKKGLR